MQERRLRSKSPGQKILMLFIFQLFLLGPILLPPQATPAQAQKSADLTTAIIRVAKQAVPAVVHIEVTGSQTVANPFSSFGDDPLLRRFFNVPRGPKKFKRETKGLGTGILIDPQGYIVTNHHVAGGETKLEVILVNGNRYPAKLIGTDPKTDLAVIRIETREKLSSLAFGNSDKVEVGQWVVAIGHPRGLTQTVTQGIISAMHRRGITEPSSYQDFLQTDAAINPGNSGGPLLNLDGEVIGVNSVIATQSGGSEGIGFAIPSNMVNHISRLLITKGKVERGWLGVSIQDISPDLAKSERLENVKGTFVADVVKGGPAEKAGMKKGDVVTAFQGKEVTDASEFRNLVAATPIGQDVKLALLRGGKKQEITLKLSSQEASTKILAASIKDRLGVVVRPVTDKEAEKYGMDQPQGVALFTVEPKGPLGEAGFEVADIILAINNQAIKGFDDFVDMVGSLKNNQKIALMALDHRTGNTGVVEATIK